MKTYILPFILFLTILLSCQPKTSEEDITPAPSPVELELDSFLQAYYLTMSERDWPLYRQFFWDKGTITTVWQAPGDSTESVLVSTIDEFIAKTPEGPDSQPIFEEKMVDSDIEVRGPLARAWVKYEAKFGTEEELMEWEGTDLFSLMQHNGQWRIVSLVFSPE